MLAENQTQTNPQSTSMVGTSTRQKGRLPLPSSQFTSWIRFFYFIYLLGLAIAIGQTFLEPATGLYPSRPLAIGMVLLQAIVFMRLVVFTSRSGWPYDDKEIFFYFAVSILLVCVTCIFHSGLIWLFWPYMGQMFGMLAFRIALPTSAATFGLMILLINGLNNLSWSEFEFDGRVFYWIFMTISGYYTYQLIRSNIQRGRLINQLEETTQQLEEERDKNAELAVLRERERLARDMHDGLGHTLVALSVQLEAIQRLYPVEPQKASAMIDESKKTIRESMDSLRRTLAGMRTPGLNDRPLVVALHGLCREFEENAKLKVECTIAARADELPRPIAEVLWRVAQESLNNVQKHAQASQVNISLRYGAKHVILEITDDGIGMPADAHQRPNRLGLTGMMERLEGLGGTFTAESTQGVGATIRAEIPFISPVQKQEQSDAAQ